MSAQVAQTSSVIGSFQFKGGIRRAHTDWLVHHRRTGHVLTGSHRQVITDRNDKIARLEEFHAAAKMAAFWRLVAEDALSTFRESAIRTLIC